MEGQPKRGSGGVQCLTCEVGRARCSTEGGGQAGGGRPEARTLEGGWRCKLRVLSVKACTPCAEVETSEGGSVKNREAI